MVDTKKKLGLAGLVAAATIGGYSLASKTTQYDLDDGSLSVTSTPLYTSVEMDTADAYCHRTLLGSKDIDDVYDTFDESFFQEGKSKNTRRSELLGSEYDSNYAKLACDTALLRMQDYDGMEDLDLRKVSPESERKTYDA